MPIAHDLNLLPRTEDVLVEKCSFQELGLSTKLLKSLLDCGFHTPSPIQYRAIPIGLCGFDLVLQAKSGTGKTLVFGLICLEDVKTQSSDVQALILSPTREIAVQTRQILIEIGSGLRNLKVEAFIGGLPIEEDRKKISGCHVAVGAPGRLKHLLVNKILNPSHIKLLILDEADQLTSKSFIDDVKYIYSCLPSKKQIITSSATYSTEFLKFIDTFMKYPSIITPKYEVPILLGIKQFVLITHNEENFDDCDIGKTMTELIYIFSNISFKQCIIFTNTKSKAKELSAALKKSNWPSEYLTSDHNQITRLEIIKKLKEFKCRVLITTDLTARGIDAENVNLVINLEVPLSHATYLHRIGRAGRYGSYGISITLLSGQKESSLFKNILYKIGGATMSVDVLPRDNIPNLWDLKIKYEFDKFGGDDAIESSNLIEHCDSNICPESELETCSHNQADRSDCFVEEVMKLYHESRGEKSAHLPRLDKNYSESNVKDTSKNVEKSENNDTLFDPSIIPSKLLDVSMKSDFAEDNLDSLLSDFESNRACRSDENVESTDSKAAKYGSSKSNLKLANKVETKLRTSTIDTKDKLLVQNVEDILQRSQDDNMTIAKPEGSNIEENGEGMRHNSAEQDVIISKKDISNIENTKLTEKYCKADKIIPNHNLIDDNETFITKLKTATADLNEKFLQEIDLDDNDSENNILRKNLHKEKPLFIKPEVINKKQLDEDRKFLEKIRANASQVKNNNVKPVSGQVINNKEGSINDDEQFAEKFRQAVMSIDTDTFGSNLDQIQHERNHSSSGIEETPQKHDIHRPMVKAVRKCKLALSQESDPQSEFQESINEQTSNKNNVKNNEILQEKKYAESLLNAVQHSNSIVNMKAEKDTSSYNPSNNNLLAESNAICSTSNLNDHVGKSYNSKNMLMDSYKIDEITADFTSVEDITKSLQSDAGYNSSQTHSPSCNSVKDCLNKQNNAKKHIEEQQNLFSVQSVRQDEIIEADGRHSTEPDKTPKQAGTCGGLRHTAAFRDTVENVSESCHKEIGHSASNKKETAARNHELFGRHSQDPMYTYNRWNQLWMEQVWQIHNHINQQKYCINTYCNYYK